MPISRPSPFHRLSQAEQARARKGRLLPLSRSAATELILPSFIALDAMKKGVGWLAAAQHLTEVVLLTRFLAQRGHGSFEHTELMTCDAAMRRVFIRVQATGTWKLDEADYPALTKVVRMHDLQLQTANAADIAIAIDQLERFKKISARMANGFLALS